MKNTSNLAYKLVLATVVLVPTLLIAYKLFVLEYPISALVPAVSYRVNISMQVDGHGEDMHVATYLPSSNDRQVITDEQNTSEAFAMTLQADGLNRVAHWNTEQLSDRKNIVYTFSVQGEHVRYEIPENLAIPRRYPKSLLPFLSATEGIQVHDPLISKKLDALLPDKNRTILKSLKVIHHYLQEELANKDFSGYTDALTALKLEEASCNGKSRLFVAMARKLNMPARLIGGLILKQGSKRVTHQWVEVYINGHWVPFDTINNHFAELPENYIKFYTGDLVMFKHTSNINFQYLYKMTRRLVPQQESVSDSRGTVFHTANFYALFERIGISQNLLKIILMLPFGVLVMAILRNVIGLETFGTFLPALIAAAARETGFWWGTLGFSAIIIVIAILSAGLDKLKLLHTPKLAIMLTAVILLMMTIAAASVAAGFFELAHITLFPVAILTITAERLVIIQTEQGTGPAFKILFTTLLAVSLCYAAMATTILQSFVLVFPESLLIVIALDLWIGRWIGIRALEYFRFKDLIKRPQAGTV